MLGLPYNPYKTTRNMPGDEAICFLHAVFFMAAALAEAAPVLDLIPCVLNSPLSPCLPPPLLSVQHHERTPQKPRSDQ